MRPLTKVQMLSNNNLELECTICHQKEEIQTNIFNEAQRSQRMRSFNTRHAKAHENEPEIHNRIARLDQLTGDTTKKM